MKVGARMAATVVCTLQLAPCCSRRPWVSRAPQRREGSGGAPSVCFPSSPALTVPDGRRVLGGPTIRSETGSSDTGPMYDRFGPLAGAGGTGIGPRTSALVVRSCTSR